MISLYLTGHGQLFCTCFSIFPLDWPHKTVMPQMTRTALSPHVLASVEKTNLLVVFIRPLSFLASQWTVGRWPQYLLALARHSQPAVLRFRGQCPGTLWTEGKVYQTGVQPCHLCGQVCFMFCSGISLWVAVPFGSTGHASATPRSPWTLFFTR